jgi:hypothetical protein
MPSARPASFRGSLLFLGLLAAVLISCGGDDREPSSPASPAPAATADPFAIGKPQQRAGIGDVERALVRYGTTQSQLVQLIESQAWYQDGLTRDESLFVERALTFSASIADPRFRGLNAATIRDKLYLYDGADVNDGRVELLLIYEPGQDAQREMALIKAAVPVLEDLVGVQFPERVLTFVNGTYGINDYNDDALVRIDRCCVLSAFVLAHELSHAYWAHGPSWFNEGMADLYSVLTLQTLQENPPPGWERLSADIEDYRRSKQAAVQNRRFPDLPLARRFASDGLYEMADVFLLDVRELIGPNAFAAAARDIYLATDFGRYRIGELRVEDIFLAHAGTEDKEKLMSLFNREVWGDDGETYQRKKEFEEGS